MTISLVTVASAFNRIRSWVLLHARVTLFNSCSLAFFAFLTIWYIRRCIIYRVYHRTGPSYIYKRIEGREKCYKTKLNGIQRYIILWNFHTYSCIGTIARCNFTFYFNKSLILNTLIGAVFDPLQNRLLMLCLKIVSLGVIFI